MASEIQEIEAILREHVRAVCTERHAGLPIMKITGIPEAAAAIAALRAQDREDGAREMRERDEARSENYRLKLACKGAMEALLSIGRRSSWEAGQGTLEDRSFLMSHWHDGFNAAARSRASRALDALDLIAIFVALPAEMQVELEAGRLALAEQEKGR